MQSGQPAKRPVVLITGGSRGIGASIAQLAAARGYDVAITYRSEREAADNVVERCHQAGARALAIQGEVAHEPDVLRFFDEAETGLGKLSHVVNNAGVTGQSGKLADTSSETIRNCIEINVLGAIWVAREAARRLSTKRGGGGGSIVNISSVAAGLGSANEYVWYAASKGAVDSLTLGMARELAGEGIRVNAVSPGMTKTELHERSTKDAGRLERLRSFVPMNRIGEPDEVAEAVLFLMSDAASYITGANLPVSGGR
jgi:NAD(P)-dependent dehydrogenase (short-subunit alcohol dehydrogenase family)